jgi:hypothetical protein
MKDALLTEEEKEVTTSSEIKEQKEEKKIPPAPFFSLFKYTTGPEKVKLVIGSLSAIAAGGVFPFFLLFFADITTVFDERYRDESASKGWVMCYKFFIVGGLTWIFRNLLSNLDFFGTYYWNIVGAAQSVRNKKEYYKALLDQ